MKKLKNIWGSNLAYDIINTKDLYYNEYQKDELQFNFKRFNFYKFENHETSFCSRLLTIFCFIIMVICLITVSPIKWCITGDFGLSETKLGIFIAKNLKA